ncbi:hypothetical protein HZH66_012240 [Vespula vulgaris]|uniref:Uncharacterized protein n=1 Tax=Vespula vulgaris TaxID=7454 RepID=A0A834JDM6_VESVU|nr:hypothetical protein HZH66_012240 [Vespula vulgaris]
MERSVNVEESLKEASHLETFAELKVCLRTQAGRSVLCRTLPGIDDTFRNKNSLKQQRTFFFDNCVKGDVEEDFEVNIIDHRDAKDSSIGLDSQRFYPRIAIKSI